MVITNSSSKFPQNTWNFLISQRRESYFTSKNLSQFAQEHFLKKKKNPHKNSLTHSNLSQFAQDLKIKLQIVVLIDNAGWTKSRTVATGSRKSSSTPWYSRYTIGGNSLLTLKSFIAAKSFVTQLTLISLFYEEKKSSNPPSPNYWIIQKIDHLLLID